MGENTGTIAKTTRPALSQSLNRKRLLCHLDGSAAAGAVWICGPPGAGKTTLAASYIEQRNIRHLWYQLDNGDNDAATFFHYLRQASGQIDGIKLLAATPSRHGGNVEAFSRSFFRDLYGQIQQPFVLVFDNYQGVHIPSPLHEVIHVALEEAPDKSRIIITSREEPPVRLARMRVNQEMQVIDAESLRFTVKETGELAKLRGRQLSKPGLNSLYEKTQGWAAGVVLLLGEDKLLPDTTNAPPVVSTPDLIFDYFAGEFFDKLDANTCKFLTIASLLPRMTASMADDLGNFPNGSDILVTLSRNDYFVTQTFAGDQAQYQLHPLLREFLQAGLEDQFSESRMKELKTHAVTLLLDSAQLVDAVELMIENEDWGQLAETSLTHASTMLTQGREETLSHWLESLPGDYLRRDPWALYWLGAATMSTSPRQSRRHYEQAYASFERSADEKGSILGICGVIDTIDRARRSLPAGPVDRQVEHTLRSRCVTPQYRHQSGLQRVHGVGVSSSRSSEHPRLD